MNRNYLQQTNQWNEQKNPTNSGLNTHWHLAVFHDTPNGQRVKHSLYFSKQNKPIDRMEINKNENETCTFKQWKALQTHSEKQAKWNSNKNHLKVLYFRI